MSIPAFTGRTTNQVSGTLTTVNNVPIRSKTTSVASSGSLSNAAASIPLVSTATATATITSGPISNPTPQTPTAHHHVNIRNGLNIFTTAYLLSLTTLSI